MTTLSMIDPVHLDSVWPIVAPMLQRAIETNSGEETLDQIRMQVAEGRKHLIIWHDGDTPISAAVVGMVQMPNYRMAHVAYMAGRATEEAWIELKHLCRQLGASRIQAFCGPAQARLFRRLGLADTYTVMRAEI